MRTLSLIAVAALLLSARVEADFGPEVLIGPAAGHQRSPDIASDGKGFLIAWRNEASESPSIEVLRVEADGTWTGKPVALASLRGPTSPPAAAACGSGWVVAWAEPERIVVHVLNGAGAPLYSLEEKTEPRTVGGSASRLGLACDRRGALVVWGHGQRPELLALAIPHGESTPRRLRLQGEDGPVRFDAVAVASDSDGFLVAWHSASNAPRPHIAALRVSLEGVIDNRRPVSVANGEESIGSLSAASAGRGDFLVAWDRAGGQGGVFAARLHGSSLVDASPLKLGGPQAWGPSAAADGSGYRVAWTGSTGPAPAPQASLGRELRSARIPLQGGRFVESPLHASESNAGEVRLASGANRAIAAYTEGQVGPPGRAPGLDIWIKGADGSPGATLLTRGPASQRVPALAARGPEYLLAWVDESTIPESIRTAVISPAGTLVPPKGSVLARSAGPRQLSVAAGRNGYLVAWVAQGGVFAARVSATGELLDPEPLRMEDGAPNVAAAFDGEAYGVAFSSGKEIRAVRFFEDRRMPEPAVGLGKVAFGPATVSNACERGSCLVTWTQHNAYYGYVHVYGLRVVHGRPEYLGTYARPLNEPEGIAGSPVVAAGGGRYVVAWGTYPAASGPYRILWRNLEWLADRQGARAGELPVRRGTLPSVTFDGKRFVAAWIEENDPDPLRWSPVEPGWGESPRSLGVKGASLALAATLGGGLTAAWVETVERAPRVRLRTLAPHVEPAPAPPPPQAETFKLSDLLERVRRSATRRGDRVDPGVERQLKTLVARIQNTTLRGRLPVDPRTLPGLREPESGPVKYRSPWGAEISSGGLHVLKAHYTGTGTVLGAAYGALVVVDGPVRIGSVADSIVIATGDVDIAHSDRSIVIAGGRIEISGDGSLLTSGQGFASILVSGRRIDAGTYGGVLAAADGVVVGNTGVATVNVPAGRIAGGALDSLGTAAYRDPGLVLSDAADAPQLTAFEVALATSKSEARRAGAFLYRRGEQQPIAWGREGEPLHGLRGPLPPELAGVSVGFVTPARVVLRSDTARADLVPSRPPREPPPPPALQLPPEVEAHAVGVYLSSRADNTVEVEVDRPGVPILLVLSAYESVRWRIRLSPGTRVVGAVVGGYHAPDGIDGLAADTPVLTRVADYGEKVLYDYPGRTDQGPGVAELVRELTGRAPVSFQGAEKGERYRIGPPAAR